jgi:putative NADPH-quinone reductase
MTCRQQLVLTQRNTPAERASQRACQQAKALENSVARSICILQGHPDVDRAHLCHALAEAYAQGAKDAGHGVSHIDVGRLDPPFFRNPADFVTPPSDEIVRAQDVIRSAQHLVIIFPLWLGTMPGLLKVFFEQLCRNGFAIQDGGKSSFPLQMLKGRSARIIVTMGMPSLAFRFVFGAHGVRSLSKSFLGMAGIQPVRETLIGNVGQLNAASASKLLDRMRALGKRAA